MVKPKLLEKRQPKHLASLTARSIDTTAVLRGRSRDRSRGGEPRWRAAVGVGLLGGADVENP